MENENSSSLKLKNIGHLPNTLLSSSDWSSPQFTGWLYKEGGIHHTIKRRFFVLKNNKMIYFKTDEVRVN